MLSAGALLNNGYLLLLLLIAGGDLKLLFLSYSLLHDIS